MYKKINLDKLIIYDIETLCNCFIICMKDYKTGKKKEFIIYDSKEYESSVIELFKFIKSCIKHEYTFVGFNNINFDKRLLIYHCGNTLEEIETIAKVGCVGNILLTTNVIGRGTDIIK